MDWQQIAGELDEAGWCAVPFTKAERDQDHEDYLAEVWEGWLADLSLAGPRLQVVKPTSLHVDKATKAQGDMEASA